CKVHACLSQVLGSMGGEKKKTPIDQSLTKADGGHRTANGVNPMSTPTSCFTNANPMPRKAKPKICMVFEK
ncbi:MAG: hypothetical protein KAI86_07265, partial [Desulfobacterales bacterium]|nr:hypothetical protein [Desulfobacterales bacterium]